MLRSVGLSLFSIAIVLSVFGLVRGACPEGDLDGDCRHPYEARPSMEACGIDVFQTARDAGFPIEVLTSYDDTPNFYSLLLVE